MEKGAEQINLKSYKYYDRILPNQDYVDDNGLGNLIALPLQGQAVKMENSVFVDENWNAYEDQMNILLTKTKLSKEFVEEKIKEWNLNNNFAFESDKNGLELWKPISLNKTDINGILSIILSNGIYIDTINISPRFQNAIRRLAAFSNPIYYKNKAIEISNYQTERIIYLGHDHYNGYIEIPRGLLEQLVKLCEKENIQYNIIDERVKGNNIDVSFNGKLYEEQKEGLDKISKYDNGILNATTAYGKTVVCSALIVKKKVSTLILLESSTLIDQWKEALEKFIDIKSELPTYVTKTGIVKKRKELIGILHGQKNTLNGIIDIAMVGSIYKYGKFIAGIDKYGMVIVDECHHAASDTMLKVLKKIKSKYVYGVTATQIRSDQLERINTMIIGPIRYKYSAKERNELMCVKHYVYPRFTRAVLKRGYESRVHPNEAYKAIISNENRNNLIIKDVQECIKSGRTPVVLSKYKEHCEQLYEKIKNYAQHVVLLTGNNSKKDNKNIINSLKSINKNESVIIIGTGSMIGEGFDYPRLDTLIMATPISFRGLVEQYAGRLNRDYDRKEKIIIYDYVDTHINMFSNMYTKRLKAYKQMGYQLFSIENNNIKESNFIFESIDFWDKIIEDIKNANESVLISSPYISSERISCLIKIVNGIASKNIKLTVITLNPDSYLFGDSSYWMQLQDDLRNVGANVELSSEVYEKYAIIDNDIVWYGNINILGKDKSEENIMRIIDKSIATELEYKSFNKSKQLTEI